MNRKQYMISSRSYAVGTVSDLLSDELPAGVIMRLNSGAGWTVLLALQTRASYREEILNGVWLIGHDSESKRVSRLGNAVQLEAIRNQNRRLLFDLPKVNGAYIFE
jgi:hypothetical protein